MNQVITVDVAARSLREGRWQVTLVALLLGLALFVPAIQAQESPTPTLNEIQTVARELYCPLCNGVRLDNCELQACVQMRQVIADRLVAGATKEQIKQEFVAQYGPVVLGEPPREGLINWLIWILPVAALIGGAIWVYMTLRGWTRASLAPAGSAPAQPSALPASIPASEDSDPYLAQVAADLDSLD